ncbi:hypothetical protein CERZMDRAFT_94697 [Cercospora zeae-maydis SCOH1-5]|uniref:Uncharacterized protein n=1 Tax=Cercospora zeae-maydis SCOH1-5 TaxID=717836 RepID=A0A6A6FQ07_9PEZI|nr:hypothetical protein CERZMDRAFT_94697 [Cercospora zeae-maydis SCOH1-5]
MKSPVFPMHFLLSSPTQDNTSNLGVSVSGDGFSLRDSAHGVKLLEGHLTKLSHSTGELKKNYDLHIHQGQGGLFIWIAASAYQPDKPSHHYYRINRNLNKHALKDPAKHQHWVLADQASGLNLIDRVKSMLREEFKDFCCTQHPECSEGSFPRITKKSAIVLCPYRELEHRRATGCWIVQAGCEFFGLPSTTAEEAHGFTNGLHNRSISPETLYLQWPPTGSEEPKRKKDADAGEKDDADTDSNASIGHCQQGPHDIAMYAVNGGPWTLCSNKKEWFAHELVRGLGETECRRIVGFCSL